MTARNIKKSPKLAAQFMLQKVINNVSTVTGKNVRMVKDMIGHQHDLLSVKPGWLRNTLKFCELHDDDQWRVDMIKEITNIKQNILELTPDEEEGLAPWPGIGGGSFHPRSVPNISGRLFSIFNLFGFSF